MKRLKIPGSGSAYTCCKDTMRESRRALQLGQSTGPLVNSPWTGRGLWRDKTAWKRGGGEEPDEWGWSFVPPTARIQVMKHERLLCIRLQPDLHVCSTCPPPPAAPPSLPTSLSAPSARLLPPCGLFVHIIIAASPRLLQLRADTQQQDQSQRHPPTPLTTHTHTHICKKNITYSTHIRLAVEASPCNR